MTVSNVPNLRHSSIFENYYLIAVVVTKSLCMLSVKLSAWTILFDVFSLYCSIIPTLEITFVTLPAADLFVSTL